MSRRSYQRAPEAVRREELISATLDCVAELGITGATIRQIAARAGVTGGLVRHYFDGKDQMMQAAYRHLMTEMFAPGHEIARLPASAVERLGRFIRTSLTPPVADARTISIWAAFIGHVPINPGFAAIHRDHYVAFLATLEEMIGGCLAEQERPAGPEEARAFAMAVNGLIDGLWLEGSLLGDELEQADLAGLALRSVEQMLGLAPQTLQA
ncbi:TetR family transcriptional regulator C-terminal domain-containing protein [Rhizobium sp. SSA_523]|uniref:TetR family transcriptional regulator C-terminal domain-containing protein n=1 Tax=Rhizobium sp. SSA_523 TaxID=2952477 RepID=UPI002091894C|nr:TetR family transcriptional regulator C-terminal domain-containing protein [Rhizobium sp. SSA_523]MCO5731693.1 TetR family transcriptional regulator C-terminal domain-containing protein [Rhizobium sp. SSA_523]WKC22931.1 TetR family transcriptional regulator C-terminal domain-containing protein [Rhizobium sp. SSA_523]